MYDTALGIIGVGLMIVVVGCAWMANHKDGGCAILDLTDQAACHALLLPGPDGGTVHVRVSPEQARVAAIAGALSLDGGCR